MDNPIASVRFGFFIFSFLSWIGAIISFSLALLFRMLYLIFRKGYPKIGFVTIPLSMLGALICSAFCLISIVYVMRYLHITWTNPWLREGGISLGDWLLLIMMFVPDVLMLILSVIVGIVSYKDIKNYKER